MTKTAAQNPSQRETDTESQPGGPPPVDGAAQVQGFTPPASGDKVKDGVPYAPGVGTGLGTDDSARKVEITLSNHLPLDENNEPAGVSNLPVARHAIPGEKLTLDVGAAYSVINAGYSTVDSEDAGAVRKALGLDK